MITGAPLWIRQSLSPKPLPSISFASSCKNFFVGWDLSFYCQRHPNRLTVLRHAGVGQFQLHGVPWVMVQVLFLISPQEIPNEYQPQDKFCNNYPPCREVWARGERVVKFIGFDIGEQKRRDHAQPIDDADTKYKKEYPLMDWSWTAAWTSTSTASGHRHGPAPAMRKRSRHWRTTGLRCRQRWSRRPPRRTEG